MVVVSAKLLELKMFCSQSSELFATFAHLMRDLALCSTINSEH